MRLTLFTTLALLFGAQILFAQRQADWSAELTGNAQAIIFHHVTGVPIIQTEKAYIGLNPEAKSVAWTMPRSADKALSAVVETGTDFYNMMNTPYVLIRQNLVDSRTGEVILSKATDDYKRVEDYEVIPSLNAVLLRTTADGKLRLYLVDMTTNKKQWSVDVLKGGIGLGIKAATGNEEEEERIDVPMYTTMVTKSKHLLYRYKKNLACIDGNSGQLLWLEKTDPGEVLLSQDEKTVYLIEARDGLVAASLASAGMKLLSNKLYAFDLLTGKSPWKSEIKADENIQWVDLHPDYIAIVHKKGCNLYDYATGEARWKKDYEARRVTEIQANNEGYLVTFYSGYKSMQLGPDGKALWKKAQLLEVEEGEEIEVPEEGGFKVYPYAKGKLLVDASTAIFIPKKGSGAKRWMYKFSPIDRVAFDEQRQNYIIVAKSKVLVINPDRYPTTGVEFKTGVENPNELLVIEIREKSYFLSGQQEYIIVDPEANRVQYKYYKKPFDGAGLLIGLSNVAGGVVAVAGVTNSIKGATKNAASTKELTTPGSEGDADLKRGSNQLKTANVMYEVNSMMPPERFNAFKETRDHAYFFTKEKKGDDAEKILVKVSKDDGTEADKLIFDNARPIYQIDEIQKRVYYAFKNTVKVFNM